MPLFYRAPPFLPISKAPSQDFFCKFFRIFAAGGGDAFRKGGSKLACGANRS